MTSNFFSTTMLMCSIVALSSCGGSSSNEDASMAPPDNTSGTPTNVGAQDLIDDLPSGDITSYGAITIGDESGMASDLVAAFFELDTAVSADTLTQAFNGTQTVCSVDDDDSVDFEEISVGFIPSFNGIGKRAISAGESIVVSSDTGTFANLQSQSAGPFLFYTLPDMQMLPNVTIPHALQVDILGDEFPGYNAAMIPSVTALDTVDFGATSGISATSVFSWTPSSDPAALLRIFSSTAGGFFLENGMTVTCLTPDTGSFTFPASVQEELGADFVGGTPIISRVVVRTETTENSVLFLIRESFSQ